MNTEFEVVVKFRDVFGFDASNADIFRVVSEMIEKRLDAEILSIEITWRADDIPKNRGEGRNE